MKLKTHLFALTALAVSMAANAGTASVGTSSLSGATDGFTYDGGGNASGLNGLTLSTLGTGFTVLGSGAQTAGFNSASGPQGFWLLDQANNTGLGRTPTFTFAGLGATAFSAFWFFSPLQEDDITSRGNLNIALTDVLGNSVTCVACSLAPPASSGPFSTYGRSYSITSDVAIRSFSITAGDGLETYAMNNLKFVPAAPVPEPETYAMMLAGLGALGFMARRRNKA